MKKLLLTLATVLMSSVCLTSCDVEIDNSRSSYEDYPSEMAGTRWQLVEIQNEKNNAWVTPSEYPEFNIKDLKLGADKTFDAHLYNYSGNDNSSSLSGFYSFSANTIDFRDFISENQIMSLGIREKRGDILEGVLTLWGEQTVLYSTDGNSVSYSYDHVRHYNVRLRRY